MWCTPEQHRAAGQARANQNNQHGPVFAQLTLADPPSPQRQRPVRVPPQSPVAFPRPASEDPRSPRYTESERQCAADMIAKLRRGDDVRGDKVGHVSEALAAGAYDNEMKLDVAIDRLLEDLLAE